ncbi:uncharacterized protein LOC112575645 isoform X2 [Pomacea canaliculata]|nr:uncharacterized protein LOC112575645 isoform X2 [Pomacea canaliculata]
MSLYDKLVEVISKPPEKRQDFEVQPLLSWFRKRTQIFAELKTELLKDIVRNCKFGTKMTDDMIIKQGDPGDCFYVVLSGKVSIYILNQDHDDEEERAELASIVQYKDGRLDREKLGNYVTTLGVGFSFGEVALIDETCVRTASIVADERTDLVIVDKALYTRSVKDIIAKEFEDKRDFIARSKLFSSWAPKYRKQLAMALYKEVWPYESTLVRQSEDVEFMYFILQGQVEIQVDPSSHPAQYPKIFAAARQNEVEKLIKRTDKPRPQPSELHFSNSIKKRDNFRSIRLCYLGINERIGDTEMTMELQTYMQTAVCKEQTDVLVLERKHYDRLFVKRHQRTIEAMRQEIGVKLTARTALLSCKEDIDFFGYLAKIIDALSRPHPPPAQERLERSVSDAEKEFLNHKGPLIDLHGPGSVFYLIKVREETKQRVRFNKRERGPERQNALRHVTAGVIAAAQQLMNGGGGGGAGEHDGRPMSARGERSLAKPRSFRDIRSAHRASSDTSPSAPETDEPGDAASDWYSGSHSNGLSVENPEEEDDARLSFLEERIRAWLRKDNPRAGPQVAQLRRLTAQDMDSQPRPGNKVVIRRRRRVPDTASLDGTPRPRKDDSRTEQYKILLAKS